MTAALLRLQLIKNGLKCTTSRLFFFFFSEFIIFWQCITSSTTVTNPDSTNHAQLTSPYSHHPRCQLNKLKPKPSSHPLGTHHARHRAIAATPEPPPACRPVGGRAAFVSAASAAGHSGPARSDTWWRHTARPSGATWPRPALCSGRHVGGWWEGCRGFVTGVGRGMGSQTSRSSLNTP